MDYSYLDLLCYLLIYSFLGWAVEVLIISIRDRTLKNRGFFNLPFCLSYGIVMDILIVLLPTTEGNFVVDYLAALAVSSVVTFLSGSVSKRISRTILWDYQENNLFAGQKRAFFFGLLQGALFLAAVLLVHPLVFLLTSLIPQPVKMIACLVICVLLCADLGIILFTLRLNFPREQMDAVISVEQQGKRRLSERLTDFVWRRIDKAYPDHDRMEPEEKSVFAKGICFDKLVWVFVIMSIGGCLFEMVFLRVKNGVWMSRASLVYGPISIIWGFGAVFLTVVLQRLREKEDRFIFLSGCLLGGIYEYTCSVISEVVFGTVFWDYSDMPFNIGGRTNLLFCIFWGVVSVWWMKWAFPKITVYIEKIPPVAGKVITWTVLILLVLDCFASGAALLRYVDRIENPGAANIFVQFLDLSFPDAYLEKVWPNLRLTG